jgi:hypothetical protein
VIGDIHSPEAEAEKNIKTTVVINAKTMNIMAKPVFVWFLHIKGKFSSEKKAAKTVVVKVAPKKTWKSNKKVEIIFRRKKVQIRQRNHA